MPPDSRQLLRPSRRAELYPEIKRLREEEGLKWREIGELLGLNFRTVHDYYTDPDNSKHMVRHRKWQDKDLADCATCGDPMPARTLRAKADATCKTCWKARVAVQHRERVERAAVMYNAGASLREIAAAFGYGPNSKPPEVDAARRLGLVGYRNRGYGEAA